MNKIPATNLEIRWHLARPSLTAVMYWREVPIAHAYLNVEGGAAVLQDIVVYVDALVRPWLPWWLGRLRTANFRRRGFGTYLLCAVLERAELERADRIEGLITDPSPWLVAWYIRSGFTFDATSSMVRRTLR